MQTALGLISGMLWFVFFWPKFGRRYPFQNKLVQIRAAGMRLWAFVSPGAGHKNELRVEQVFIQSLLGLEQTLQAGLVPSVLRWNALPAQRPLHRGLRDVILDLYRQGAPLLPALKRSREWVTRLSEMRRESWGNAQGAWAQYQILLCAYPISGVLLWTALPELHRFPASWRLMVFIGGLLGLLGLLWAKRILVTHCTAAFVNVFGIVIGAQSALAALETGSSAELAWSQLVQVLRKWHPTPETLEIPLQLWEGVAGGAERKLAKTSLLRVLPLKQQLLHCSMEGRALTPILEQWLSVELSELETELRAQAQKSGVRLLPVLFLGVGVPILALVIGSIGLVFWSEFE